MDWNEGGNGHSHGRDGCHHGNAGHSHSHGPRAAAFGGMTNMYMPAYGQMGKGPDPVMDISQQPKKWSQMDDGSSWDIVKATQFGILERCKELVEAGYDVRQPDKENVSLLHWAAINNRSELVKYYMSKGAIVDQLGGDLNSTPLHWAIRQGHLPMVIQLMRYGADPSITDGEGYRSLHLAILFQHMAIAAYLMAKGEEVDVPDCNGQTPLMLAAQKIIGPEPTNFLIKNNASVSAVDKVNRNTPLHCAVLAGNVDAAHILLEAGASVDAENINGHTPMDLARQVQSPLLIHMLNVTKQERIRSNSRCLRFILRYKVLVQFLFCTAIFGCIGAIFDMNSESWLLKSILLACVVGVINLASRNFPNPDFQSLLPPSSLMASVFWMLVTWCLWFLPDLSSTAVQVLFTLNATAFLYYFLRTCRTDPGFIKATEEQKKMVGKNVVVLAEAGCLDPRVFCTSCMVRKPLRAVHCFSCDTCVAKQDHHSVWTNTCIGARNHYYFVLLLLSLSMMGGWMIYGCFSYWASHCLLRHEEQGVWGVVSAVVSCSPWVLAVFVLSFYHTCWSTLFLIGQLYQIAFLGLTTPERTNMLLQQRRMRQSGSLRQNPFNMGVVQNLVSFFQLRCCGLCKPAVVDWTAQFQPQRDQYLFDQINMV
ncbi:putative palmitoyltransferase ZDHHC13 isoform X1 [Poecilia latipinna]|uniref:putative palmitoyltransferase ZDHHC13 isoform X1 n=2 Tax=Poecilia latipinna TaxID=48699 RepID=UPI00072E4A0A|nr:PREDICTED: palmitoyltransferase ZDHHC13 isoform X1 [Poecilia latipinna]